MNDIKTFNNQMFGDLPVVMDNGKTYFGATDAAKMLGYSNPHDALLKHCKKAGVAFREVSYPSGTKKKKFISEGNLYRLITHSKLPAAEKFETWVFDEVLPTIRKTGEYKAKKKASVPDTIRTKEADAKLMNARARVARQYHKMLDEFGDVLSDKSVQQLIALEANVLSGQVWLIDPHVEPEAYSAGDLGKPIGWSAQKVGRFCKSHNIKRNGIYGEYRMSKSKYSPKQIPTFVYNAEGRKRFYKLAGYPDLADEAS